jgi:hypothetical protein
LITEAGGATKLGVTGRREAAAAADQWDDGAGTDDAL